MYLTATPACPTNAVVVLCENRPPPRGAIEWAAAQVAPPRPSRRAAKRQRLSAEASADGASASVDSSSGPAAGRGELDETADSSAHGADGAETAAEAAGRVVAGIVRRGPDQELLVQVCG